MGHGDKAAAPGPCQVSQSHPTPGVLFPYSSCSSHPLSLCLQKWPEAAGAVLSRALSPSATMDRPGKEEERSQGKSCVWSLPGQMDSCLLHTQLQLPELLTALASLSVSHRNPAQKKGPFPWPSWEEQPLYTGNTFLLPHCLRTVPAQQIKLWNTHLASELKSYMPNAN